MITSEDLINISLQKTKYFFLLSAFIRIHNEYFKDKFSPLQEFIDTISKARVKDCYNARTLSDFLNSHGYKTSEDGICKLLSDLEKSNYQALTINFPKKSSCSQLIN